MITELIEVAQAMWLDRKDHKRERGFHASQGGNCIKKVIIDTVFPELAKPFPATTKQIFEIGHMFHDQMDEALRHYSRETGRFLWVQPFRLKTFGPVMEAAYAKTSNGAESPVPLVVHGTPDFIGIHVARRKLMFADFKTSNERAFAMKKKGNRSNQYAVQIGSYLPGIYEVFKSIGMPTDFDEISIIYINKADRSLVTHVYDENYLIPMARGYWEQVAMEFGKFVASGMTIFPKAAPQEDWMCNYCSVFNNITECQRANDYDQLRRMNEGEGKQHGLFT